MPIYRQTDNRFIPIKEKKLGLEKTLQNLVEANLSDVFGLSFVATKFPLNYLGLIRRLWSQSRVMFVAQSFTKYQQEAIGFQDLPIELWEVKKYEEDLVSFNQVRASEKSESIKTVTKNKDIERVSREIKQYSVEDHIKPNWSKAKELFDEFSQRVLELDPRFEIRPVKYYIGFNIENKNIVAVKVRTTKLLLELLRVQPKDLKDPEKRTKYRKNSFEYYNKHITQFDINSEDDIDYTMSLVKQVYRKFIA